MLQPLGIINFSTFFVGVLLIIITPGPNSLYVLSAGARHGRREGAKAMAGILAGDATLMFLASAGAAAAIAAHPLSFAVIRYAGAAYLAFLGLRMLVGASASGRARERSGQRKEGRLFFKSLLVSLSNPSTIIFYMAFFVQFVAPESSGRALPFLLLALVVQSVSFSYLTLLIFSGSALAGFFRERMGVARFCRYGLGLLFIGFGLRLIWDGLHA